MAPTDVYRSASAGYKDRHPWVVLSFPTPEDVLVANFTDIANDEDHSCIVEVGEHPQITKRSVIFYRGARLAPCHALEEAVKGGLVTLYPPITKPLWDRIMDGAARSPAFLPKFLELLVTQGLLAP